MSNVYHKNGYKSRAHYLVCLAEEYEVSVSKVRALAGILGDHEDFDGLVSALDDLVGSEYLPQKEQPKESEKAKKEQHKKETSKKEPEQLSEEEDA